MMPHTDHSHLNLLKTAQHLISSTTPRRSGWILVLGLAFFVPLFTWWGANVQIHPVAQIERDANDHWRLPYNLRWALPMDEAVDFKVNSGPWLPISQKSSLTASEQKIWLRWPTQSLWTLIGLELLP